MKFFTFILLFLTSCAQNNNMRFDSRNLPRQNVPQGNSSFIKKKLIILPFYNETPVGEEDLSITATEELRNELSRTRDYTIQTSQDQLSDSKQVYASGGSSLTEAAKKARASGVNLIIYGRIMDARVRQVEDEIGLIRKLKSEAESTVELRVYDVHAKKEVFSQKITGTVNDSNYQFYFSEGDNKFTFKQNLLRYTVRVAMRRFIPLLHKIGGKLEWTGRVAKIVGNNIYINAGRDSGLNIGDILKVVTEGQEIYDPESGEIVGISKGDLKGTLEIIDFFGADGSVTILHSGGSVTEGDFVQLY